MGESQKRLALYLYGTRSWHLCFNSITPRTAGIATVDYNALHPITLFITIIFMFIGAGPNSTGGGVKISTIAVAFSSIAYII